MGITQSEAIAPHLQSYFLILNKNSLPFVKEYFNQNGLLKNISEVIATYEVGLSTNLLSKNLTMVAFIDNNAYTGEFSPYYQCADYHLMKGIPLIKKKIIFSTYRKDELFTLARMNFNIDKNHYISLIKKTNPSLILDFDRLAAEMPDGLSQLQKWQYAVTRVFINVFRPLYKKLK
jgi:lipopolysaccharide biosynthesis protein